jgi:molybdate transport repressor ModE-like protein
MRFDLVDLRLFLLIAESGSITRGAERAGLALASASERIKGMEDGLGAALLERRRRGVALTPAGHALVHHAHTVQNQAERMAGDLGQYAKGLRAQVRLLSNTAAAAEFVPEILSSFLTKHANIDVVLEERASHMVVESIASGAADLGIAAAWAGLQHLEQRFFRTDRLVIISSRRRAAAARSRAVMFEEMARQPFVGLGNGNPLQEHVVKHAARLGYHLSFRVRVASIEAVCRLASAGVGVAVLPESAVRRSAHAERLRMQPLKDEWATRRLMLCARAFDALSPHARLLADALANT